MDYETSDKTSENYSDYLTEKEKETEDFMGDLFGV